MINNNILTINIEYKVPTKSVEKMRKVYKAVALLKAMARQHTIIVINHGCYTNDVSQWRWF